MFCELDDDGESSDNRKDTFILTKYKSDDQDNGLIISFANDRSDLIEVTEMTEEYFNENYSDDDDIWGFTWNELWDEYDDWINEMNEFNSDDESDNNNKI